jgi:hypothetical protein
MDVGGMRLNLCEIVIALINTDQDEHPWRVPRIKPFDVALNPASLGRTSRPWK